MLKDRHCITVIGMGLEGVTGLSQDVLALLQDASVIAGPRSRLAWLGHLSARLVPLDPPIETWIPILQNELTHGSLVLLATGDPLFFGIGRLLLQSFPATQLIFYPHVSSVQLAFSRIKRPWQQAQIISVHGRSMDHLEQALKQGASLIGVLTDAIHTPAAIAQLIQDLQLPSHYRLWICSRLGAADEKVQCLQPSEAVQTQFELPNVVILERVVTDLPPAQYPLVGIPDNQFVTFPDQPGLITKQEIRALTLMLLQLPPQGGVIWDIGAGTGSISIEIARLLPTAQVYAIEKNAVGIQLIQQNCSRFQVPHVQVVSGAAPAALTPLPDPDRIVVGGGGSQILEIIDAVSQRLTPQGIVVGNFATLEPCLATQARLKQQGWSVKLLQANLARSSTLVNSTRLIPLNPVMLVQGIKPDLCVH